MKKAQKNQQQKQREHAHARDIAEPKGTSTAKQGLPPPRSPRRVQVITERDAFGHVINWSIDGLWRIPKDGRSHVFHVDATRLDVYLHDAAEVRQVQDYREQYPLDRRESAAIAAALRTRRGR